MHKPPEDRAELERLSLLTSPACPGRTDEPDDDPWSDESWDMGLPGEQAALDALTWNWGRAYDIGVEDGEWWFQRRNRAGGRETATTPDELHSMIITDYSIFPPTPPALPPSPAQPATGSAPCGQDQPASPPRDPAQTHPSR